MSASTWSKTGRRAASAGGRSPDWWRSAARPIVFSATVLPPVFGPLITSARTRSELEVDRDRRRGVEQRMTGARRAARRPRSRPALRPRPARARRTRARGRARRSTRRAPAAHRPAPQRPTESSPRMRSTSSRASAAASARRLFSSTTANGSTNSVCPVLDASCTTPGTFERAEARTASTGRPPRSARNDSCSASRTSLERATRASSSRTRAPPLRSSVRSLRSSGDAVSRTSEPSSSIRRSISSARPPSSGSTARGARRAPAPAGRASPRARRGSRPRSRAARRAAAGRPDSTARRRCARRGSRRARARRRAASTDDRGRRQLVPALDRRRVGGRRELACERHAVVRRGEGCKTIDDRRQLERSERRSVHNAPV